MDTQQLNVRLQELLQERERGQTRLAQLDQQRLSVQQTLLRIDGAIQLLNELLQEPVNEVAQRTAQTAQVTAL